MSTETTPRPEDERANLIRQADDLDPIFRGVAKQLQGEYDYWIHEMRATQDRFKVAEEQVRIRERLLLDLRDLL